MKKWVRRTLLFVATAMVVLLGGALVAVWLVRAEPAFYRPTSLSPQERAVAAASAEEKFIRIQNQAARINAADHAAARRASSGPIQLDGKEPVTITFTDAELNSFFEKWSNFQNWKRSYEPYMSDPAIVLKDGRLILAAKLKDPNLIVSLHFEPTIDKQGRLNLELARILGGRLPLPEAFIAKHEQKLADALVSHLPRWQQMAKIDAGGAANPAAISAAMTKLLAHVLRHESAEPVLFLPVIGQSGSVPVKILDVKIEDGIIALTVQPMSRDEHAALLERIRQNEPTFANLDSMRR